MYICIGGGGKVSESLGTTLLSKGHEVVIIEKNPTVAERLAETLSGRFMVLQGDVCDLNVLKDAGVEHADIYVAATGQDDDNLVSCETVQVIFHTPRVIARVNNPKNERIFRKLGIEGISVTSIISGLIEKEAVSGELRMVMSLRQGDLIMMEIELPQVHGSGDESAVRVADIELPPSTVLVSVARGETLDTVNGNTLLYPGDVVVACVKSDYEEAARQALINSVDY